MPANYDMIISQSPPSIFSHSPPASFLNNYMSSYRRPYDSSGFASRSHHHGHYGSGCYQPQSPLAVPSHVQRNHLPMKAINVMQLKMAPAPKSCLATKNDHHNSSSSSSSSSSGSGSDVDEVDCSSVLLHSPPLSPESPPPPSKAKRVVFADDKGLELTHVKIMSEPSNVPPYWTLQFLAEVTHGLVSPVAVTEQWGVDFKQPASEYLEFRRTLEEKSVSLENVIVRESESLVVGTVKVRNLSFDKEVIIRVTYDGWKSQEDIQATYSNLGGPHGSGGAYALYDTFSFKLTLPPASKRSVEFCVCFRCNGTEYWDSNNGQNYKLSKRMNGSSMTTETDSILTNSNSHSYSHSNSHSSSMSNKMNEVTTIIQDLKMSSWRDPGMMESSYRPYW